MKRWKGGPEFMGTYYNSHLYCLVGCVSMIVWTRAVLGVNMHVFSIFVVALVQRS